MSLKNPTVAISNPKAECAGMSQMWLGLSLSRKEPLTDITMIKRCREDAQKISAGTPSDVALPKAGLKILNHSVFTDWSAAFNFLLNSQVGYYYITIKYDGGAHAMAAIRKDSSCYYFEPESGIYLLTSSDKEALASHYASLKLNELKIYCVELSLS